MVKITKNQWTRDALLARIEFLTLEITRVDTLKALSLRQERFHLRKLLKEYTNE